MSDRKKRRSIYAAGAFATVLVCLTPQVAAAGAGGFWGGFADGLNKGSANEESMANARVRNEERKEARKRQANRVKAGQLVAAGKCEDARALALGAGDFDLDREIARSCTSTQGVSTAAPAATLAPGSP